MAKRPDRKLHKINEDCIFYTAAGTYLLIRDGDLLRLVLILEAPDEDPGHGKAAARSVSMMWLLWYSLVALIVAVGVFGGGITVTFDVLSFCVSITLLAPRRA